MHFILSRSKSLFTLSQAYKTCGNKAKVIQGDFIFKVESNSLYVITLNDFAEQKTKLETIDLKSNGNEFFMVNAQLILDFIKATNFEELVCSYNDDNAPQKDVFYIGCSGKDTLLALPTTNAVSDDGDSYVPIRFQNPETPILINGKLLSNAFAHTSFSAHLDSTKSPLTAVNINCVNGILEAISCDEQRISKYTVDLKRPSCNFKLLVPKVSAEIIMDSIKNEDAIEVILAKKHFRLNWSDSIFEYTSVKEFSLGTEYPNLNKLFELNTEATVEVSKADLLSALKVSGLFVKDSYVTLGLKNNKFTIIAQDSERGVSKNEVAVQSSSGEIVSNFAYKHLVKAIDMIETNWITLEFVKLPNDQYALLLTDGPFQHLLFGVTSK